MGNIDTIGVGGSVRVRRGVCYYVEHADGRREVCRKLSVVGIRTGVSVYTLRYRMKVCVREGIRFSYMGSDGVMVRELDLWL